MSSLKQAKTQLRRQIKESLRAISQESLQTQSNDIHKKLLGHPVFQKATKIALYMNMPDSEVKTDAIIHSCYQMGKQVYLPRCKTEVVEGRKNCHLVMLRVPSYEDVKALKPQGKYQLLEPIEGVDAMDEGDLDVVIVPGVVFSTTKQRMGHGAGFYDEFIKFYNSKHNRRPYLIGLGLHQQFVNSLPTEEHDWDLDSLVISGHDIVY
ncbi:5,10-methenyltetrahydrofolate synthetase [Scheffersomyces stipitis CBS 6054]|uniref:5-formyltetrahydrofolate cyclo-ligase n=1 Tax=Scheffersomyces stipitis (strain ATCC 58785 / CBS 6054 / NBRC 10063 / NRRL Y-11545) TaxID=322104 RepID=A3LUI4_PICST|nr:5,10-methenyltetrahydrofolate synthetase [Scheffersomyces stipitis CBS 6054]ABN66596.2 5,10-methenyltetrahydrofolate synthetase [Scheffersomyces stipitis CBS 6054]